MRRKLKNIDFEKYPDDKNKFFKYMEQINSITN